MDTRYIEKMSNSLQAMIKVTDDIDIRMAKLEATLRGIEIVVTQLEAKVKRNEALMQAIFRNEGMAIESDEDFLSGGELDDKIGQEDIGGSN